jgi:hypothetical protein
VKFESGNINKHDEGEAVVKADEKIKKFCTFEMANKHSVMNIELEKIKLAQKIFNIDSEDLIARIKDFISTEELDIWDALPDEVKVSVEKSLAQAEKGELIPHEEALKRVKRWL